MSKIEIENETFYEEWKEDRLLDLVIDINLYCRKEAPTLLVNSDSGDLIDILKQYIKINNPFEKAEDSESDSDIDSGSEYSM